MESRNCSLPAPEWYRNVMHYTHILSFPLYLVTLTILFNEKSKLFQTYKYYIIVNIFINFITESYVSFFMLPMTYLPYPLFRTTGWMAQWGFSGLVQFYIMAQVSAMTVGSILEMFYYRLKVTIVNQQVPFFIKFARFQLNVYRFTMVLLPVVGTITFEPTVANQQEVTMNIWLKNSTSPPEITCYSVIIAVLDNKVFWITIPVYIVEIIISVSGSVGPLIFIVRFMKKSFRLSKETMKLQKILIVSLFIQSGIHGVFIIIPTCFQVFAMFYHLDTTGFAYILLLFFSYHGFLSTCAMIIFTKPLRAKLLFCSRWNSRKDQQVGQHPNLCLSKC